MTVREAFEKAYGPIPEGATCHIGWATSAVGCYFGPVVSSDERGLESYIMDYGWDGLISDAVPIHGDIGPELAVSFRGFFGPEYDEVVR